MTSLLMKFFLWPSNSYIIILFIVIGFFIYRKRPTRNIFTETSLILGISVALNIALKESFMVPPLPGQTGWSFPSGHQQAGTTFILFLFLTFKELNINLAKKKRIMVITSILSTLILILHGSSLVYFRYHSWIDVWGGFLVASFIVLIFRRIKVKPNEFHHQINIIFIICYTWAVLSAVNNGRFPVGLISSLTGHLFYLCSNFLKKQQ